jgi:hypothetical protein
MISLVLFFRKPGVTGGKKTHGQSCHFLKSYTVRGTSHSRGKVFLRFEIVGVISQSLKNKDKITISLHNRVETLKPLLSMVF